MAVGADHMTAVAVAALVRVLRLVGGLLAGNQLCSPQPWGT